MVGCEHDECFFCVFVLFCAPPPPLTACARCFGVSSAVSIGEEHIFVCLLSFWCGKIFFFYPAILCELLRASFDLSLLRRGERCIIDHTIFVSVINHVFEGSMELMCSSVRMMNEMSSAGEGLMSL